MSADVFSARSTAETASSRQKTLSEVITPSDGFDWAGYAHGVQAARREREGHLMWDCLAGDVGLTYDYPPMSSASLTSLVENIQTLDVGRHDRDNLLLYLLLDLQTEGSARSIQGNEFCKMRHIPRWRQGMVEGYWSADHSAWPTAVSKLSTLGVPLPFHHVEALLHLLALPTLNLPPRLAVDFFRHTAIPLDEPNLRTAYVRALAGVDFGKAWFWVWTASWISRDHAEQEEEEVAKEKERLIKILLDWSLIPRPRKAALEALLTLPFDTGIQRQVTAYLLQPQANLPPTSFSLLHDLLNLRLISHGEYASAIDLDRRVAALHRPAQGTDERDRRALMRELVGLLPDVQQQLLSMDEMEAPAQEKAAEDLAMSWEPVDLAASASSAVAAPAGGDSNAATPSKTVPLSASTTIRTSSTSNLAILQAVRQVQPASPIPQRFSPGPSSARRPDARGMDSPLRNLLNARTASPYAGRSASPFAQSQRTESVQPEAQQPRSVSAAGLLRHAVSAQQQATPIGAMRNSPAAKVQEMNKQATPVPSRVFRRLGGWDEEEQRDDSGPAEKQEPQAEDQDMEAAASESGEQQGDAGDARPRRATRSQQPVEKRESPKRKEAEQQVEKEPVKRTRRSRATSSQPVSSPPPTRSRQASSQPEKPETARRTTRQTAKAKEAGGHIPGAFPGTVPEEPEDEPEPEQPQDQKALDQTGRPNRRARSVDKQTDDRENEDKEKTPARRTKRARQPTAKAATMRMTRAQSVMSNATTEAGDDESMASHTRRRSARLSSAAPSSPARSEVSVRQTRSRKGTQDAEATPKTGVRTRRQAAGAK